MFPEEGIHVIVVKNNTYYDVTGSVVFENDTAYIYFNLPYKITFENVRFRANWTLNRFVTVHVLYIQAKYEENGHFEKVFLMKNVPENTIVSVYIMKPNLVFVKELCIVFSRDKVIEIEGVSEKLGNSTIEVYWSIDNETLKNREITLFYKTRASCNKFLIRIINETIAPFSYALPSDVKIIFLKSPDTGWSAVVNRSSLKVHIRG